jgi:4-alpha-glucanotransferase
MGNFHLVLLIHGHQPVGNFDSVFEQIYQQSYLPFVEHLERHPAVRLGLHYSGCLLEWMEERHPEFLVQLRRLVARRQVEMVGGGYYEPILVAIPSQDQTEQLRRLNKYLARHFGKAPTGAWLTERVWEPQLPSVLASAELTYTLVDDLHFLAAGFELDQLHGAFIAEDGGYPLRVLPSLKALRYLLPFRSPEETILFLRKRAAQQPGGMAAMGDDCEKFGGWPGTYDHCYRDGWVERFFMALESASDWLVTTPPGEYVATHAPLGRADLPTASYPEMMEWVLPTASRKQFHALSEEFASRPDVLQFLRGGQWRGFFSKYPESNLLQKKMLRASERVRGLAQRRWHRAKRAKLVRAREHVLRAQCNDAYWHGVFGGLYAPHLRTELWRELVRAETLADEVAFPQSSALQIERCDFDADGAEELVVSSPRMSALIRPAAGGTLGALDFRPSAVTLINSLQRRPEAYHDHLREVSRGDAGGVASIHDSVRSREEGLERFLHYDRWPRNAFRLLLFSPAKSFEDYATIHLDENAALAGGDYTVRIAGPRHIDLSCETLLAGHTPEIPAQRICCLKRFSFAHDGDGCTIACAVQLSAAGAEPLRAFVGLELVLNLLAPNEPDRYFETPDGRHTLRWSAAVPAAPAGASLRVVDEWQNVAATINAPAAAQFWVAPIETVSESELGFERVYQGSQILVLWPVEIAAGSPWRGEAVLRVAPALRPVTPATARGRKSKRTR